MYCVHAMQPKMIENHKNNMLQNLHICVTN